MNRKSVMIVAWMMAVLALSCRKETAPDVAIERAQGVREQAGSELALVLQQVYKDEGAYQEVEAAIRSGFYEDERVLLQDLLRPWESDLYRSDKFGRLHADTGRFRKAFWEVLSNGSFPALRSLKGVLLPVRGPDAIAGRVESRSALPDAAQELAIYSPYSSSQRPSAAAANMRPTIVFSARDTDRAMGREPFACGTGVCYRDVLVDDSYAEQRPVHIISQGADPSREPVMDAPAASAPVTRVYSGWCRLSSQFDRLISFTGNGGGSEIKIGRITGYLRFTDQQVTNFSGDLATVYFSREDIRKKRWKRVYVIWDPNWNYQDIEQVYAVYEEDTQGETTFNGSVNTTLNLPGSPSRGKVVGELGFKVSVKTQDEVILQRNIDRKSFMADALANQGWGFMAEGNDFLPAGKDWPIMDGGAAWSFTMPYRDY